jgi:hypothetical protein
MEKKTVFLEIPCELLDKLDRLNALGDRSAFFTELLEKQVKQETSEAVAASTELTTAMNQPGGALGVAGEIDVVTTSGASLGRFNVNTIEGFEDLAKKIQEFSEDPIVRIRARRWR